jgi:hypothetical protein
MNRQIRNLVIFSIISIGAGFIGIGIDRLSPPSDPMQGLGVLIWLASPLAINLILRAFGGDKWADLGLRPYFKQSWGWYLIALAIPVIVTGATLAIGAVFGKNSLYNFSRMGFSAFLPFFLAGILGAMMKNFFEEFAWRGYLTPRLEAIGAHPFINSILTGFVWAGWHIPYYLYFLNRSTLATHTSLALPAFILVAFLVLPFHALAYGELRLLSKSVWPVWLLHNIANAISLPLFDEGFVDVNSGFAGVLLSPGTDGIVYSLLMGLVGLWLYQVRRRKAGGQNG